MDDGGRKWIYLLTEAKFGRLKNRVDSLSIGVHNSRSGTMKAQLVFCSFEAHRRPNTSVSCQKRVSRARPPGPFLKPWGARARIPIALFFGLCGSEGNLQVSLARQPLWQDMVVSYVDRSSSILLCRAQLRRSAFLGFRIMSKPRCIQVLPCASLRLPKTPNTLGGLEVV